MLQGLKIACRYSYMPHKLGFCGPSKDQSLKMKKFLEGDNKLADKIKDILSQFVSSYSYYCLIAKKNKIKDPFDEKVVEAYWLGNELLDKITVSDLKKLVLEKFVGENLLNMEKARKIVNSIDKKITPLHHFHVLKIGSVTGKVDLKGKMIDLCLVNIGKVEKVNGGKVIVEYNMLRRGQACLASIFFKRELETENIFKIPVKIGDTVSFHWGVLCDKVTKWRLALPS